MNCKYCAGTGDFFDSELDDWAPGEEKCSRCEGWGELGRAVDEQGRFCGMIEKTKRMAPTPDGLTGYCGANCKHCSTFKVYVLDDEGVWACAADYEEN